MKCNGMQGLCDSLTRGINLLPIYIYIYIYIKSNVMQGLYAQLAVGVYQTSIYTCIVLDLTINLIWCTGMEGIYAS